MSPEQISMLTAAAAIIDKIGAWPIGSIVVSIIFGPWIFMLVISRAMEKRHNAALSMYESNVRLVEKYEKVAEEQVDTIRLSTSATVELTTYLRARIPCFERIADRRSMPRCEQIIERPEPR